MGFSPVRSTPFHRASWSPPGFCVILITDGKTDRQIDTGDKLPSLFFANMKHDLFLKFHNLDTSITRDKSSSVNNLIFSVFLLYKRRFYNIACVMAAHTSTICPEFLTRHIRKGHVKVISTLVQRRQLGCRIVTVASMYVYMIRRSTRQDECQSSTAVSLPSKVPRARPNKKSDN